MKLDARLAEEIAFDESYLEETRAEIERLASIKKSVEAGWEIEGEDSYGKMGDIMAGLPEAVRARPRGGILTYVSNKLAALKLDAYHINQAILDKEISLFAPLVEREKSSYELSGAKEN